MRDDAGDGSFKRAGEEIVGHPRERCPAGCDSPAESLRHVWGRRGRWRWWFEADMTELANRPREGGTNKWRRVY